MRDLFGRDVHYLRVSVTDRCNLRCAYCRPPRPIEPAFHSQILSYEEILRLCVIFSRLGFDKFRLTGGEPLLRRDFVPFVRRLREALPEALLALTTNGLLLAEHAENLKSAGLDRVNVSLDTLREEIFRFITGSTGAARVLEGVEAALGAGLAPVKLNVVVMRGVNEGEIPRFVERFRGKRVYIRFIEFMPYGINGWDRDKVYPHEAILADLSARFTLRPRDQEGGGPSRDFDVEGAACRVGIISPLTRSFCADCNRLRLTSDGQVRACLFGSEEVDLKALLRGTADDGAIEESIRGAILSKPRDHNLSADTVTPQHFRRSMRQVGG
jgi:cyclic pyranopterin phosphate synthase